MSQEPQVGPNNQPTRRWSPTWDSWLNRMR